jgi:hypothetical protein
VNNQTTTDILEPYDTKSKSSSLKEQPYNIFLVFVVIVVVVPIICWGQGLLLVLDRPRIYSSADIFMYGIAFFLILYWVIYRVTDNTFKIPLLTWIHVCATVVVICYFILFHVWYPKFKEPNELKAYFLKAALNNRTREMRLLSPLGIVFLVGQVAFVGNVLAGATRKKRHITKILRHVG